ncbi:uncharacterized protein LOC129776421 isoform X2 [Toxorhynchites rutilus septentrionalis]|uniref:uncharacterized protein LOC129776421 isoform X2 n=1 Tax=Toxorhynchites rutilus septentrionalis TaxID=329112 RepID=UPI002478FD4C|nr:uncharacterized protein LOC129776421 isoform X2 [Toxorhynchites rutilus septentrionalis]
MLKKLPVRSLSELCLAELAGSVVAAVGNMLQMTYSFGVEPDFTLLMAEIESYLENMGAPSCVYEDLLRVILCSDSLEAAIRFCCLQMFLNEGVRSLSTEIFPSAYYERTLKVIAEQGRGLRQLNMKGVWVKEENMCFMYEIIKHLPHLSKLIIPHIANDDLLKHIGDYSKNLRHLDISGDTDITEIGLEYLCYGAAKNLLTVVDIGSLGEENICHTDVALLTLNLPNVISFGSYSFVGRSLLYIVENKDPAFQCKIGYLHDTKTSARTADAIVSTCPELRDVYLDYPELGALARLSETHILRLKLCKFSCSELLGLLENTGDHVRHLTLMQGRGIMELHQLIRCCPYLVDLDMYMMESITYAGSRGFNDLQGLEILHSPLSEPALMSFLRLSTSLKRIAIDTVAFNDEDIATLVIDKDFYRLEDVWFTVAPHLTVATVELLMDRCPELQSLGQLSGWRLNPDDVRLVRAICRSSNSSLIVQSL